MIRVIVLIEYVPSGQLVKPSKVLQLVPCKSQALLSAEARERFCNGDVAAPTFWREAARVFTLLQEAGRPAGVMAPA